MDLKGVNMKIYKPTMYLIISLLFNCILLGQTESYIINKFNTPEEASDSGNDPWWTEYDETEELMNYSTLSQIPAADVPDNNSAVMDWTWSVVGTFIWGGYTGELKFFDEAVDLSEYNYLSFKVYNMSIPQGPGVSFRFCLFDVSDSDNWSSRDDVEVWYSFFEGTECPLYNASEDGWTEYRIPLQGSGTMNGGTSYTQGFTRTGWAGIEGNNIFDSNSIGGLAIEVVHVTQNVTLSGEFLLEDIQAINSSVITGCIDETACNYNPEATVDDGSCYECSEITFVVDMSLQVTHAEGVYIAGGGGGGGLGFGNEGVLMEDPDQDDIWTKTLPLPVGENIEYKYRNRPSSGSDDWGGFEEASGLEDGGCATGPYNDRFFTVPDNDIALDTVCYAACTNCDAANFVNVTFSVNMQEEETDPAGVWLAGGNFGGNPGFLMADSDLDDIWTITLPASPNTELTYKFVNGPINESWQGGWEELPGECAFGDYGDRQIELGAEDLLLPTVCFGKCIDCFDDYPVDVTFNLDMSDVSNFDGSEQPYLFGSFNNWDNFSSQVMLADDDGDNIYTGVVSGLMFLDSITVLYGYGTNFESVPEECSVYDSELMINVRRLPIQDAEGYEELILDPIKYGECPVDNTPRALFQVDVSSVIDQWPDDFSLCVTGVFDGWSGCGTVLSDNNGDQIYTGIVTDLEPGVDYEYKFLVNNQWGISEFESGAPFGSSCDFNPNDEYNNYGFTATEGSDPLNLGIHFWNECPVLSNDENKLGSFPTRFSYTAYPNPFNPYINIQYELPQRELVNLSIFNLLGQQIKILVNAMQKEGNYAIKWDGTDMNGNNLQSGIYFAVIDRESGHDILKITYLK